jgi:hypothetical protein
MFINEPQTSITFNSTVSTDNVPWLEGPITNNGTSQQYQYKPYYMSEISMWYCPVGRVDYFWTSTNAIDWTSRTRNTGNISTVINPSYVAKKPGAGNYYVQAYHSAATNAANYTSYSTNGITWFQSSNRIFDQSGEAGTCLVFGANIFVLGGYYWKTGSFYDGLVATSTDGVTWANRQVFFSGFSGYTEYPYSAAFGAGVFAVGSTRGSLRTSTNGTTWTIRDPLFGGNQISHITFANGRFLAGGDNGTLRTSTDSVTWTSVQCGIGTANINNILYDEVNGVWSVMASAGAVIRVSTDLVTWVTRSSAPNSFEERAITWGNGLYVQGYTDTQARSRWFRVSDIRTLTPSVPFTDTYIILEYKGRTRTLS